MADRSLTKRAVAEWLGTAFLVAAVVGSGIMGERLAAGNVAIALLANTVATGAALIALILTFGGISGAHFNPVVTLADAIEGGISWRDVPAYVSAQVLGGITGAAAANVMFRLPLFSLSQHARNGPAQVFSEFVATFGLLAVIWGCSRARVSAIPFAVGAYITAAYWFTSSTSFANPAVTIARGLSDTFAGIRPLDIPFFVVAQFAGAMAATVLFRWLIPSLPKSAKEILVPHDSTAQSGSTTSEIKTYLFACTHNAGRSQMAAALFNLYGDPTNCHAISAGTQPAMHVHPEVVQVMREIGIDLASARPQRLTDNLAATSSVLITMGCGESCPYVPGLRRLDWELPDPKGQSLQSVREIRDTIHERVKELMRTECADCFVNCR
jgi:glycerol uptake facilitator-like aquaporin/protein-tyrosine-phosphatase